MEKFRKAYYDIEANLDLRFQPVIILQGLRGTGKTAILKQLAWKQGGYYINFKETKVDEAGYLDILKREEKLILMDEICWLENYDSLLRTLPHDLAVAGKQAVITSCSYGALKQLSNKGLGGGRSHVVELFPLSFEEYLYFSGRISEYGEDYEPSAQDVEDFYGLVGVPDGLAFELNDDYFLQAFADDEAATADHRRVGRDILLTREQYAAASGIIAKTLSDLVSSNLSMSQSLIGQAERMNEIEKYVGVENLARILAFLFNTGFLLVDLKTNERESQISDKIVRELLEIGNIGWLEDFLTRFEFSVISPLLYTIGFNKELHAIGFHKELQGLEDAPAIKEKLSGILCKLAMKSEAVYQREYDVYHDSYKYLRAYSKINFHLATDGYALRDRIEVDINDGNLLLEVAQIHKTREECHVDKAFMFYQKIRVLTDEPGAWEDNGIFHRIGYPKALLMMSNGSLFKLEARKVVDTCPIQYSF